MVLEEALDLSSDRLLMMMMMMMMMMIKSIREVQGFNIIQDSLVKENDFSFRGY
jgi:hypothetical protein